MSHLRFSASVSFMFTELPLLERFAAARRAGFDGVEIQRLSDGDPQEMRRAADDAGVDVVLVNVGSGDYPTGGNGLSGVPDRCQEFRDALERAVAAAQTLGASRVHLGPSRVPVGVARDSCLTTYLSNARLALALTRPTGITLLVEAMNRTDSPTALFADVDSAAAVVRALHHPRLGLQFDVYHCAMNSEDPIVAFTRHREIVRHVQFADVPGRHEPGTGTLDLPAILRSLRARGYTGWLGAEYQPIGGTAESLGWMTAVAAGVA